MEAHHLSPEGEVAERSQDREAGEGLEPIRKSHNKSLTRIFSTPYGSETTSLYFYGNVGGYAPLPGSVSPASGDVLIRLPEAYRRDAAGEVDLTACGINLAIVEALIAPVAPRWR